MVASNYRHADLDGFPRPCSSRQEPRGEKSSRSKGENPGRQGTEIGGLQVQESYRPAHLVVATARPRLLPYSRRAVQRDRLREVKSPRPFR